MEIEDKMPKNTVPKNEHLILAPKIVTLANKIIH